MLTRAQKQEQVEELRDRFARATSVFVADYRGLSVPEVNALRKKLRSDGDQYEYQVRKNSLLKRASTEAGNGLDALGPHFQGPTAVAFSYGDPVGLAKILVDYAKDHEQFELKGGFLDGKPLDEAEIATLATLPTLDELRGKLVGLLQAPASKLARLLNEPASQIARLAGARREQLEEGGS
ncbi:MAG: 50S ribosomal protein L10 [Proteobacteria bacterium]|nr:50S ribosomal protein L10 [Pseudomonadota bacterium]